MNKELKQLFESEKYNIWSKQKSVGFGLVYIGIHCSTINMFYNALRRNDKETKSVNHERFYHKFKTLFTVLSWMSSI